uniref:Sec16 Sec23-binding domain-containing protein n=1 Tax=Trypanosoma vivax (strain Y486) TaxID=1055687 RepID=G0TT57_TRYVY|nr:conserved hypothetical protein, fragment [Trypanosoma vivax Y486]
MSHNPFSLAGSDLHAGGGSFVSSSGTSVPLARREHLQRSSSLQALLPTNAMKASATPAETLALGSPSTAGRAVPPSPASRMSPDPRAPTQAGRVTSTGSVASVSSTVDGDGGARGARRSLCFTQFLRKEPPDFLKPSANTPVRRQPSSSVAPFHTSVSVPHRVGRPGGNSGMADHHDVDSPCTESVAQPQPLARPPSSFARGAAAVYSDTLATDGCESICVASFCTVGQQAAHGAPSTRSATAAELCVTDLKDPIPSSDPNLRLRGDGLESGTRAMCNPPICGPTSGLQSEGMVDGRSDVSVSHCDTSTKQSGGGTPKLKSAVTLSNDCSFTTAEEEPSVPPSHSVTSMGAEKGAYLSATGATWMSVEGIPSRDTTVAPSLSRPAAFAPSPKTNLQQALGHMHVQDAGTVGVSCMALGADAKRGPPAQEPGQCAGLSKKTPLSSWLPSGGSQKELKAPLSATNTLPPSNPHAYQFSYGAGRLEKGKSENNECDTVFFGDENDLNSVSSEDCKQKESGCVSFTSVIHSTPSGASQPTQQARQRRFCHGSAPCFSLFTSTGNVVAVFNASSSGGAPQMFCHRTADLLSGKVQGVVPEEAGRHHLEGLKTLVTSPLISRDGKKEVPLSRLRNTVQQLTGVSPFLQSVLAYMLVDSLPDWRATGQKTLSTIFSKAAEHTPAAAALHPNYPLNSQLVRGDQVGAARRIQQLLLIGDREEAVSVALKCGMYTHAIIIAMMCPNKEQYMNVIRAVVQCELDPLSPLSHAYCMFNELPILPFAPPTTSNASCDRAGEGLAALRHVWVQHVAVLVSNFAKESAGALVRLADALLDEGMVEEAHCCLLLVHLSPMGTPRPGRSLSTTQQQQHQHIADLLRARLGMLGGRYNPKGSRAEFLSPKSTILTEVLQRIRSSLDGLTEAVTGKEANRAVSHGIPVCSVRNRLVFHHIQLLWLKELGLHEEADFVGKVVHEMVPAPSGWATQFTLNHLLVPLSRTSATATVATPSASNSEVKQDRNPLSENAGGASLAPPANQQPTSSSAAHGDLSLDAPLSATQGSAPRGAAETRGRSPFALPSHPPPPPPPKSGSAGAPPNSAVRPASLPPPPPPAKGAFAPCASSVGIKSRKLVEATGGPSGSIQTSTNPAAPNAQMPPPPAPQPSVASRGRPADVTHKPPPEGEGESKHEKPKTSRRSRSLEVVTNFLFRRSSSTDTKKDEPKKMIIDTEKPPQFDPVTGRYLFEETDEEKKLAELIKAGPSKPKTMPPPPSTRTSGNGPMRPRYVDLFNTS